MKIKIHDSNLSKGTSLLTNAFLKTPIFSATRNEGLIEQNYKMFNYELSITGKQLNNNRDLDLFLWIINKNEKNIKTTFKEILTELGVINSKVRINNSKKEQIKKSLHKLNTTSIKIIHDNLDCEKYFNLINDVNIIDNNIEISVNEMVCQLYKQEKFNKLIKVKNLENLSQYERSLYLFICSYAKSEVRVSIEKLKDRFASNLLYSNYKDKLKITLNSLAKKGSIGSYFICEEEVLYIYKYKMTKKDMKKLAKEHQKENFKEVYNPLYD